MTLPPPTRRSALDRLTADAPFLARLAELFPEDVARFLADGTDTALAAVTAPAVDEEVMRTLRRWRGRTALLLALGDLSGEHDVAATTRRLSEFADTACDLALAAAFAERVPDAAPQGLAVIALGKLGSFELNYSSDIDPRSEEHTSELQSLMRISYAVFCLKKKTTTASIQQHVKPHSNTKHTH